MLNKKIKKIFAIIICCILVLNNVLPSFSNEIDITVKENEELNSTKILDEKDNICSVSNDDEYKEDRDDIIEIENESNINLEEKDDDSCSFTDLSVEEDDEFIKEYEENEVEECEKDINENEVGKCETDIDENEVEEYEKDINENNSYVIDNYIEVINEDDVDFVGINNNEEIFVQIDTDKDNINKEKFDKKINENEVFDVKDDNDNLDKKNNNNEIIIDKKDIKENNDIISVNTIEVNKADDLISEVELNSNEKNLLNKVDEKKLNEPSNDIISSISNCDYFSVKDKEYFEETDSSINVDELKVTNKVASPSKLLNVVSQKINNLGAGAPDKVYYFLPNGTTVDTANNTLLLSKESNVSGYIYQDEYNNSNSFGGLKDNIVKIIINDEIHPESGWKYFHEFMNLTEIENLTNLKTDCMDDMSFMFNSCEKLSNLDLSHFNTSQVLDMSGMFSWMLEITNLDLSSFNTSKVTNMESMFSSTNKLSSINLSSFNTSNVEYMDYMFESSGISSINLSKFNTSKVETMECMFVSCENIEQIDISTFTAPKLTNVYCMFAGCTKLKKINATKNFSINSAILIDGCGDDMFLGCNLLKGGSGTSYSDSHTDYTYAVIDGFDGKSGYFTGTIPKPLPTPSPRTSSGGGGGGGDGGGVPKLDSDGNILGPSGKMVNEINTILTSNSMVVRWDSKFSKAVVVDTHYDNIIDSFVRKDNTPVISEWVGVAYGNNNKIIWYRTDYNGRLIRNRFITIGDKVYYLNANGEMVTGKFTLNGYDLYFETATGENEGKLHSFS